MLKKLILFCVICLFTMTCTQAMAEFTLTDPSGPNSSVTIDPNSTSGVYQWLVEGTNQMSLNSYWYRIGDEGTASSLLSIGSPDVIYNTGDSAKITYANLSLSIDITYMLIGGDPGSGQSDLSEIISITNLTTSSLDFHLFEIANFDLNNTAGDDTAWQDGTSANLFQQDGVFASLLSEGGVNGLTHWEINGASALYDKINGTSFGDLSGDLFGSGLGDVAWGVQKDFSIGPLGGGMWGEDLLVDLPEPGAMASLGAGLLGLLGLIRRRR